MLPLLAVVSWLVISASASLPVAYKHPIFAGEYGARAYANLTTYRSTLLDRTYNHLKAAGTRDVDASMPGHKRFDLFHPFIHCPPGHPLKAYGVGDGEKFACSPLVYGGHQKCVVYSLGSNNDFTFEESVLASTDCDVITLDCTVEGRQLPGGRHKFLKKCIGQPSSTPKTVVSHSSITQAGADDFWTLTQTMEHFGHNEISLLKMDIEAYEYGVFAGWHETDPLPMQVAFELHYASGYAGVMGPVFGNSFLDLSFLAFHLSNLGYGVVSKADNPACDACTEIVLLRVERMFRKSPSI